MRVTLVLNPFVFAACLTAAGVAIANDAIFPSRTAYLGVNMGGGSTEWKYLVDTADPNGNPSTPSHVSEGGPSWGLVVGYNVGKNFALEWQYMQFANAHIQFDRYSTYALVDGISSMVSRTDAFSFSLKFLTQFGHSRMRGFAAVGPGFVERNDPLAHTKSCIAPYLSTGLLYNLSAHWLLESGFQYYTGFGRAELKPVKDFIPFAWDAYGRLAYQF